MKLKFPLVKQMKEKYQNLKLACLYQRSNTNLVSMNSEIDSKSWSGNVSDNIQGNKFWMVKTSSTKSLITRKVESA